MKKYLAVLLAILGIGAGADLIQAQAVYQATEATQLRARVEHYNHIPPTQPVLMAPENNTYSCISGLTFSWKESTDDQGIANYTFKLTGDLTDGNSFDFERTFAGPVNDSDYEVWFEDGVYYLRLKSNLAWGSYHWLVTARDGANNNAASETWAFDYLAEHCQADCSNSLLTQVQLVMPEGSVDNANPAIVLQYPENGLPKQMTVVVDEQEIFSGIEVTNHTTAQYSVTVETGQRQIIIQPFLPYLPDKLPATYQITVKLKDEQGCEGQTNTNTVTIGDGGDGGAGGCTTQALVPRLTAPTNNYVANHPVSTFSWEVCSAATNINQQVFTLNEDVVETFGATAIDNEEYSLTVENLGATACGPVTMRYTLVLKNVNPPMNDPGDLNDWNRWSVRMTGCNSLTVSSPTYRFRRLPELLDTYSWCSDQQTCTSGSLSECLASGKNCYYSDPQTCSQNAAQDCGPNPPLRTYFWCSNREQCTRGLLTECGTKGRNCYLQENSLDGKGCIQRAEYDCSNEAEYLWCQPEGTCGRGNFDECLATGMPCYRAVEGDLSCPSQVLADCTSTTAVASLNPYVSNLLQQLGLSDNFVLTLQSLSTEVFPLVSLSLLLPFGIILLFFPRPRGLVFDQKTRRPVAGALVAVMREGVFVAGKVTNKNGFYEGFKLLAGEYQIVVSQSDYTFPSKEERPALQSYKRYYLGEVFTVHSEFAGMVTYQIPVDLDPLAMEAKRANDQKREADEQEEDDWRWRMLRFMSATINFLGVLWGLSFVLVIVFTLLYPIWLHFILLMIYLIGLVRRLLASLHRANVTGRVFDEQGQAVKEMPLTVEQIAFKRFAAETMTSEKDGYFEFNLNEKVKYVLSLAGFNFVEENGEQETIVLDFSENKKLDLTLVIKAKDAK